MSGINKAFVHTAVMDMFDKFGYTVSVDDHEKLHKAMHEAGYPDLADAWYDWCSDDEEGWPNESVKIEVTDEENENSND